MHLGRSALRRGPDNRTRRTWSQPGHGCQNIVTKPGASISALPLVFISENHLHLSPHGADAAVGEIAIQKAQDWWSWLGWNTAAPKTLLTARDGPLNSSRILAKPE